MTGESPAESGGVLMTSWQPFFYHHHDDDDDDHNDDGDDDDCACDDENDENVRERPLSWVVEIYR